MRRQLMGFLIVTDQTDLGGVADSVVKGRLGKKARASALDAIREANPELDFSRLKPGAIVRIPAFGTRDDAAADGLGAVDELLGAATDVLKRLAADAADANDANDAERNETSRLLKSEVRRLGGQVPELREN